MRSHRTGFTRQGVHAGRIRRCLFTSVNLKTRYGFHVIGGPRIHQFSGYAVESLQDADPCIISNIKFAHPLGLLGRGTYKLYGHRAYLLRKGNGAVY